MVQYVEEHNYADVAVLRRCAFAALSLAAALTMLDIFSLRRHWKRGESNNADKLSIVITISNLCVLGIRVVISYSCWNAIVIQTVFADIYIFSRGINILFFVYRAKSVQGPNPVLSEKWLTTYIPTFICIFYGICFLGASYDVVTHSNRIICVSNQYSQAMSFTSSLTWLYAAVELSITAFITFLFVYPLWKLYKSRRNDNVSIQQQRSMRVLEDALRYGVLMTAINLLSSNNLVIGQLYGKDVVALRYLAIFDPVINIGSTIMLFKRNRVLLWKLICHIRYGLVQMCCCAFIMETESRILDSQQAQRDSIALNVLTQQIANINDGPDLNIVKDSITEFNDATFDIELKDCS